MEIELAYITHASTQDELEAEYGITGRSLRRHWQSGHLSRYAIDRNNAIELFKKERVQELSALIVGANEHCLVDSLDRGDVDGVKKASGELRGMVKLIGEATGLIAPGGVTVNNHVQLASIIRSPEWERVANTIVGALEAWPEARIAVGDALAELQQTLAETPPS